MQETLRLESKDTLVGPNKALGASCRRRVYHRVAKPKSLHTQTPGTCRAYEDDTHTPNKTDLHRHVHNFSKAQACSMYIITAGTLRTAYHSGAACCRSTAAVCYCCAAQAAGSPLSCKPLARVQSLLARVPILAAKPQLATAGLAILQLLVTIRQICRV